MKMVFHSYNLSPRSSAQLSVLFLFLVMITHQERFFVQGKSLFTERGFKKGNEGGGMLLVSSMMIGSRPPRCVGICLSCGPCEPVQVPATQEAKSAEHSYMNTNGRGDESSNYKPINWKCKCGNFIFNP